MMFRSGIAVLLLAGLTLGGCGRLHRARGGGGSEAKVNGESISSDEFFTGLKETPMAAAVLQKLIFKKLLSQEAGKKKVVADEKQLGEMKSDWQKRGVEARMLPLMEREARTGLLLQALIAQEIPADEPKKFYDMFAADLAEYDTWHILLPTADEAETVLKELKGGRSFDVLVAQYSRDQGSRRNKGYLGWLVRGQLAEMGPKVEEVVTHLQPGTYSPAVRSPFGYHVFQVTGRRTTFEELQPSLMRRLAAAREAGFVRQLYTTAKIESPYRLTGEPLEEGRGTPTPLVTPEARGTATVPDAERGTPVAVPEGDRGTPVVLPDSQRGTPLPEASPESVRGTPSP